MGFCKVRKELTRMLPTFDLRAAHVPLPEFLSSYLTCHSRAIPEPFPKLQKPSYEMMPATLYPPVFFLDLGLFSLNNAFIQSLLISQAWRKHANFRMVLPALRTGPVDRKLRRVDAVLLLAAFGQLLMGHQQLCEQAV